MMGMWPTICGEGNSRAFDVEVPAFKDLDYKGEIVRYVGHSWRARRQTDVTCASERNSGRESADAATDNGDLELLETRWRGEREVRGIHERV